MNLLRKYCDKFRDWFWAEPYRWAIRDIEELEKQLDETKKENLLLNDKLTQSESNNRTLRFELSIISKQCEDLVTANKNLVETNCELREITMEMIKK